MSFTITATSRYSRPLGLLPLVSGGNAIAGPVTTDTSAALPTVKLRVDASGTSPTIPLDSGLRIVRVHADGSRHQVLTEQGPRLSGGSWTWLDIHCPYNQNVNYEATANSQVCTTKTPLKILSAKAFLIHPASADKAVRVDQVASIGDLQQSSRAARFTPIGGLSVFLSDGYRDGIAGSVEIRVTSVTALRRLFADDAVILFNSPATAGWDLGWIWMQPGDITYNNPADKTTYPYRYVKIAYQQAADPIVDEEPAWTSADALRYWTTVNHKTSADMPASYADCLDFLIDIRIQVGR